MLGTVLLIVGVVVAVLVALAVVWFIGMRTKWPPVRDFQRRVNRRDLEHAGSELVLVHGNLRHTLHGRRIGNQRHIAPERTPDQKPALRQRCHGNIDSGAYLAQERLAERADDERIVALPFGRDRIVDDPVENPVIGKRIPEHRGCRGAAIGTRREPVDDDRRVFAKDFRRMRLQRPLVDIEVIELVDRLMPDARHRLPRTERQ